MASPPMARTPVRPKQAAPEGRIDCLNAAAIGTNGACNWSCYVTGDSRIGLWSSVAFLWSLESSKHHSSPPVPCCTLLNILAWWSRINGIWGDQKQALLMCPDLFVCWAGPTDQTQHNPDVGLKAKSLCLCAAGSGRAESHCKVRRHRQRETVKD